MRHVLSSFIIVLFTCVALPFTVFGKFQFIPLEAPINSDLPYEVLGVITAEGITEFGNPQKSKFRFFEEPGSLRKILSHWYFVKVKKADKILSELQFRTVSDLLESYRQEELVVVKNNRSNDIEFLPKRDNKSLVQKLRDANITSNVEKIIEKSNEERKEIEKLTATRLHSTNLLNLPKITPGTYLTKTSLKEGSPYCSEYKVSLSPVSLKESVLYLSCDKARYKFRCSPYHCFLKTGTEANLEILYDEPSYQLRFKVPGEFPIYLHADADTEKSQSITGTPSAGIYRSHADRPEDFPETIQIKSVSKTFDKPITITLKDPKDWGKSLIFQCDGFRRCVSFKTDDILILKSETEISYVYSPNDKPLEIPLTFDESAKIKNTPLNKVDFPTELFTKPDITINHYGTFYREKNASRPRDIFSWVIKDTVNWFKKSFFRKPIPKVQEITLLKLNIDTAAEDLACFYYIENKSKQDGEWDLSKAELVSRFAVPMQSGGRVYGRAAGKNFGRFLVKGPLVVLGTAAAITGGALGLAGGLIVGAIPAAWNLVQFKFGKVFENILGAPIIGAVLTGGLFGSLIFPNFDDLLYEAHNIQNIRNGLSEIKTKTKYAPETTMQEIPLNEYSGSKFQAFRDSLYNREIKEELRKLLEKRPELISRCPEQLGLVVN